MPNRNPGVWFACAILAVIALSACSPGTSPSWKPSSIALRPTASLASFAVAAGRTQTLTLASRSDAYFAARRFKPTSSGLGGTVQATSGATPASGTPPAADATSAASKPKPADVSNDPVASACLKCHGPFEALAEKTVDYVTEWDERANPHVVVPHDSNKIITCLDCHEAHELPVKAGTAFKKATVTACYSCHHAETFAACTDCHNE